MIEHNHIPEMVSEVVRGKALARIVEGAQVTDQSGNVVDLANLQPDGSLGDPSAAAQEAEVDPEPGADSESVATESEVAAAELAQEAKQD
jgi:trigger factor